MFFEKLSRFYDVLGNRIEPQYGPKYMLPLIRNRGLDALSEKDKKSLEFGVEKGLFKETDIIKAQDVYYLRRRLQ